MGSAMFLLRRLSAAALVIVGTIGWGVAITSPAAVASSCTIKTHCYAVVNGPKSGIVGDNVLIAPSCLSIPSGNLVTDEMWLTHTGTTTYWVEAGYLQIGAGLSDGGIAGPGRFGFWAYLLPGHKFYAHVLQKNPSLRGTTVTIVRAPNKTYVAWFGAYHGVSPATTLTPTEGQWWSETTTVRAHSLYTGSQASYLTGSDDWHSGVPNAQVPRPGTSQTFRWIKKPVSYRAGVAC